RLPARRRWLTAVPPGFFCTDRRPRRQQGTLIVPKPWELTSDEFIGPYVVGEAFAIDGRNDADWEWVWDDEEAFIDGLRPAVWISGCGRYAIREFEADFDEPEKLHLVLLHDNAQVVGFHFAGMNWVDPAHRGQGLGVQLVIEASEMLDG